MARALPADRFDALKRLAIGKRRGPLPGARRFRPVSKRANIYMARFHIISDKRIVLETLDT